MGIWRQGDAYELIFGLLIIWYWTFGIVHHNWSLPEHWIKFEDFQKISLDSWGMGFEGLDFIAFFFLLFQMILDIWKLRDCERKRLMI